MQVFRRAHLFFFFHKNSFFPLDWNEAEIFQVFLCVFAEQWFKWGFFHFCWSEKYKKLIKDHWVVSESADFDGKFDWSSIIVTDVWLKDSFIDDSFWYWWSVLDYLISLTNWREIEAMNRFIHFYLIKCFW